MESRWTSTQASCLDADSQLLGILAGVPAWPSGLCPPEWKGLPALVPSWSYQLESVLPSSLRTLLNAHVQYSIRVGYHGFLYKWNFNVVQHLNPNTLVSGWRFSSGYWWTPFHVLISPWCMSTLVKCLFKYFDKFLIGVYIFLLQSTECSLYSGIQILCQNVI